jgi:hypothetical protein
VKFILIIGNIPPADGILFNLTFEFYCDSQK